MPFPEGDLQLKKKATIWVSLFFVFSLLITMTGPCHISMAVALPVGQAVPVGQALPDDQIILDEAPVAAAAGSFKVVVTVKDGESGSIFRMADWAAISDKAFVKGVMLDGFSTYDLSSCTFGIENGVLKAMTAAKIRMISLMTDSGVISFKPDAFAGVVNTYLNGKTAEVTDAAILFFDMKRLPALKAFPSGMPANQELAPKAGDPLYSNSIRIASTEGGVYAVQTVPADTRLDMQMVLSWPYAPKNGTNIDKLTAWSLSADGRADNEGGRYNTQSGLFQVLVNHSGSYAISGTAVSFKDVSTHWAKGAIYRLSSMGVIAGSNGYFRPDAKLTRADFAKMLVLAKKLMAVNETTIFTDVKKGDWHNIFIAAAVADGFIDGYPDGTFSPDRAVTRQEMAVMVRKALGDNSIASDFIPLAFEDEAMITDDAYDSVAIVTDLGIMKGKSGIGKAPMALVFDPTGVATRGEAAAVVYRYLDFLLSR